MGAKKIKFPFLIKISPGNLPKEKNFPPIKKIELIKINKIPKKIKILAK